jgi:hypothetical protein
MKMAANYSLDINNILRQLRQRQAGGGWVPPGFAQDVVKSAIATQAAKNMQGRALDLQEKSITNSKEMAEKNLAHAQAQSERNANLLEDQIASQRAQGIGSLAVQAPLSAWAGYSVYKSLFGNNPKDAGEAVKGAIKEYESQGIGQLPGKESSIYDTTTPAEFYGSAQPTAFETASVNQGPLVPEAYTPVTDYEAGSLADLEADPSLWTAGTPSAAMPAAEAFTTSMAANPAAEAAMMESGIGGSSSALSSAGGSSWALPAAAYIGARTVGKMIPDSSNEIQHGVKTILQTPGTGVPKLVGETVSDITGIKEIAEPTNFLSSIEDTVVGAVENALSSVVNTVTGGRK